MSLGLLCCFYSCLLRKKGSEALYELQGQESLFQKDSLMILPGTFPDTGNAAEGLRYLISGDAFSSGIPYSLYKKIFWLRKRGGSPFSGFNQYALNDFSVYQNENGAMTATPGCLHCHAQQFNNELVIGLGNSYSNFQVKVAPYVKLAEAFIKIRYGKNSNEWKNAEMAFEVAHVLENKIRTRVQGPSPAQKIAEVMASHRDPVTLKFRSDTAYFSVPLIVIPEDVPALWIAKKRKAFTVNALRQGDFLKHIVAPTLLTLKDTTEARRIYDHMKDVWAYIKTLQPPEYPLPINKSLAKQGKQVFLQTCSGCHGTYDKDGTYPNEVIPPTMIGTDSLMWKYFLKYPETTEWFNKSWFAISESPAFAKPQPGYVPPPLDGVWITAPYFHNGSVPTLEGVLNSNLRPRYWKRDFDQQQYDYENVGWKYKKMRSGRNKKIYNTDIPGYGNYGHYFGDYLSDAERKAVLEYLKTL